MATRPLHSWTLRELFSVCKRLSHELGEHVDQAFVHSVHDLERLLRADRKKKEAGAPTDIAVHNVVNQTLESFKFTDELSEQLKQTLLVIQEKAQAEVASESESE